MQPAPTPTAETDAATVHFALMTMCPEAMRAMFAPMIEMAIAQIPAESLSTLARDLQSAMNPDGTPDMPKLIAVGKQFGLTDEMIAGYQASFAAAE